MIAPSDVPERRSISRSNSKNGRSATLASAEPSVVLPAPRRPTSAMRSVRVWSVSEAKDAVSVAYASVNCASLRRERNWRTSVISGETGASSNSRPSGTPSAAAI
jgi:hypothetical protein